jgi:hypothetical protein
MIKDATSLGAANRCYEASPFLGSCAQARFRRESITGIATKSARYVGYGDHSIKVFALASFCALFYATPQQAHFSG